MLTLLLGLAHASDTVTLLHTNDWQSRLLGVPNRDYTPESVGDDGTQGGVARLATLAQQLRETAEGATFLLDAGDITMGSLFHLTSREHAGELRLMHLMQYDGAALGNHDFDFRPAGLTDMVRAAERAGAVPPLLASNLLLSPDDPRDDGLEKLFDEGLLLETRLIERGGVTLGLIGILGRDATEVMGQADPVTTADAIEVSTRLARQLREQGADLVVALSHSGVSKLDDGSWGDEDVEMMRAVPELDVVISGHSHTALHEPILVDGRPVVQAGANTHWLGELTLTRKGERWTMEDYTLHAVDDEVPGHVEAMALVNELKEAVGPELFSQRLATVTRPMTKALDDPTLGNLVTDAIREAVGSDLAVTGNGTIRAELAEGPLVASDLFLVNPLGIGTVDDSPGYALVKAYVSGRDLKAVLEFLLVGYVLKGDSYYPRLSGAEIVFNTRRVPMDQIVSVTFDDGTEADFGDDRLYSVGMSTYIAGFLPMIPDTTFGLLDATLVNAEGQPTAVDDLVYDGDPGTPGIQEVKASQALRDYVGRNPVLPVDEEPRLIETTSMALLKNSSWKQKTFVFGPLALLAAAVGGVGLLLRRRRSV
jgi:5'-nucleotidase / UDP-sugar diphosphatase